MAATPARAGSGEQDAGGEALKKRAAGMPLGMMGQSKHSGSPLPAP